MGATVPREHGVRKTIEDITVVELVLTAARINRTVGETYMRLTSAGDNKPAIVYTAVYTKDVERHEETPAM